MKSRGDSSGQRRPGEGLGPFWAIVRMDLGSVLRNRITIAWLSAAVFIQVVRTLGSTGTGTASVVSSGLSDFVYIWSLVIIGLTASAVSSEAGELADSIMSKSVTRLDYVLAKFFSRAAYVLICFSLTTAMLVGLSLKLDVSSYDPAGLVAAVLLVALMLVALTALGVGLSVAMPSTVTAMVTLLVLWYSMTLFFPAVGLGAVSPGAVAGRLSDIIAGGWAWGDWESVGGFLAVAGASVGLASAYFSAKDI